MPKLFMATLPLFFIAATLSAGECPHSKCSQEKHMAHHSEAVHAVSTEKAPMQVMMAKTMSDQKPAMHMAAHGSDKKAKDIVDTAASLKDFSTLVAAVKAAGLVDALKGEGPYTVFAPTNEAFEKLPEGTLASLLQPENKEKLTSILLYHVVPGKVMAKDVVKVDAAKTLLKNRAVSVNVEEGKVFVDDAQVVKTDVGVSNGVIHVIDSVILP